MSLDGLLVGVNHGLAAIFNNTPRQRRVGRYATESGRIMLTLSSSPFDPLEKSTFLAEPLGVPKYSSQTDIALTASAVGVAANCNRISEEYRSPATVGEDQRRIVGRHLDRLVQAEPGGCTHAFKIGNITQAPRWVVRL
jgi:hypothetical protein